MFSHYFDKEIISLVVRETNRFSAQTLTATSTTTIPPPRTWETSAAEIKAYLGFQILMGINRLPEIRDYWAKDEKLHYSYIDRFEEVSRYLHFVDNTALPSQNDPGYHQLSSLL